MSPKIWKKFEKAKIMHPSHSFSDYIFALLDWFIPNDLKGETESLRRARMFMVSHLFGPFLGHTIVLCLLFLSPKLDVAWGILFFSMTLFWIFPFGVKLKIPYSALAMLSVQNLTFAILWGCYAYGGLNSPLTPWVITIPLLAFFYLGSSWIVQLSVMTMVLSNLVVFYLLSDGGRAFPQYIPLSSLAGLGIVSTLCAAAYVSMMALYYGKVVSSQPELEREVAQRFDTAEKLRQATEDANLANQAKSDFLAKMSHELRTPLNAIIGYSAILFEDMEESGQTQQCCDINKIQYAGEHLLDLINNLLDLSKLEAGKMDLCLEPLVIDTLVGDVTSGYRKQINATGNIIAVSCPNDIGIINGDATKLGHVLSNLLSNAAKFTRNGTIEVIVSRVDTWINITVRDDGIGIESHRLRSLFQNFDEDVDETTSKYGEARLGLPLCAKLCQLMGGSLYVESEIGKGSSFHVRVPVDQARLECLKETSNFVSVSAIL